VNSIKFLAVPPKRQLDRINIALISPHHPLHIEAAARTAAAFQPHSPSPALQAGLRPVKTGGCIVFPVSDAGILIPFRSCSGAVFRALYTGLPMGVALDPPIATCRFFACTFNPLVEV
jgi:hypothetical protein